MISFFKQTKNFIISIAVFCIAMIILIWTSWTERNNEDRKSAIDAAVQRNDNLAVAFEQYTVRTIDNIDAILQSVKTEYERNGNSTNIKKLIESRTGQKDVEVAVAIANEKGNVIFTDFPSKPNTSVNVSDRPHFQYHAHNPDGGLYISSPVVSRTLGKPVIPFTRRINKPDGSFGGIVSVQVLPSTFTHIYAQANLQPLNFISLIAPNGITYARRTGNKDSYGEDISKSPLFQHVSQKSIGNYFAEDAIRHIPTYISYRKLAGYPIIATVGTIEKEVLADYYAKVQRERRYIIIIITLLIAFSFFLSSSLLLRKKHLDMMKESEEKYRTIYEKSKDAILLLNANRQVVDANPSAFCMFKTTKDKMRGSSLDELVDANEQQPAHILQKDFNVKEAYRELRFAKGDGSYFIGEVTSSYFKNSSDAEQWIVIIRDVTERKRLNKKLLSEQKKYQRNLTRQVIQAQEKERETIGRELHDNVNQILTTIKLYIEIALADKSATEKVLLKSIGHLSDCISEIRQISRNLSAPTLGTRSLTDSLEDLVETVSSSSGLYINFDHEDYNIHVPLEQKLAIYRIMQEQLNNIIKHAKASSVNIVLGQTDKETFMTITDNGKGFDTTAQRNGIGLNNILSRVKVFEGEVKIQSGEGEGCALHVTFPFKEELAS